MYLFICNYSGHLATYGGSLGVLGRRWIGQPQAVQSTSYPIACELPEAVRKQKGT